MDETKLSITKLVELGDTNKLIKNYNRALQYYDSALKSGADKLLILEKMGELYIARAENDPAFYKVAIEYYRNIIEIEPLNENANEKLIHIAVKSNTLGELATEYKEKIKKGINAVYYGKLLKNIYLLSTMDKGIQAKTGGYKPNLLIRIMFDFVLMPAGILLLLLPIFIRKIPPMPSQAVGILLFYAGYRLVIHLSKD